MDPSSPCRLYHEQDFDHQHFLHSFCTPHIDKQMFQEVVVFPLKTLQMFIKPGKIFADFSFGPIVFHLLQVCDFFSEIIILEPNQHTMKELEKWLNKEEGCLDCACSLKFMEDMAISGIIEMKEKLLRSKITKVVKFDFKKQDPTDPFVMPKADCLLDGYLLQNVSQDREDYCRNLKKLVSVLKVGGNLVILGTFSTKKFSIADSKLHTLDYDEEFLRGSLKEAGLKTEVLETMKSQTQNDMLQYKTVYVAIATKEKEI